MISLPTTSARYWRQCSGELEGIQSVIENEAADEWARGAALNTLVTLVAAGQKSREEILSYFARLFRGKLVRQWSHVWDVLVSYSSDLYPAELIEDIERAYEEGLVDPGCRIGASVTDEPGHVFHTG